MGGGLAELRCFQILWEQMTTGMTLRTVLDKSLSATIFTDCKSAYDTLPSYAGNKNKRCHLELVMTKEDIRHHGHSLRWVATEYMLSDPLMKLSHSGEFLRDAINSGMYPVQVEEFVLEENKRPEL